MYRNNIFQLLTQLNIDHKKKIVKDWVLIRCPFHYDRHISNCGVNVTNGVINCYVCGSHHISTLIKNNNLNFDLPEYIEVEKKDREIINYDFDFVFNELHPNNFYYTKVRGFTKEFCKEFNIVHCYSGKYIDYFIIPIIDKKQNIKTYEARKLLKKEIIFKYLNKKGIKIQRNFEKQFDNLCIEKDYRLDKDDQCILDKNNKKIFDVDLLYLFKPKVLYPFGSGIWKTIFNSDNLDFTKPLYIIEGLGSFPKVYLNISKNVTTPFGSKVSEEQFKLLGEFKNIIIIPDYDKAGYLMIKSFWESEFLLKSNILVCDIEINDENKNYVQTIKDTKLIEGNEYLIKRSYLNETI